MAEAVFSLSAEITPVINEREIEKQAEALKQQLNAMFAKSAPKVEPTGNFRPFIKQIQDATKQTNVLQKAGDKLRGGFNSVVKAGRAGFLKVSEALNITRTEITGFNGSILDAIRDNTKFEKSLDFVKDLGGSFADVTTGGFGELAATVKSGTSVIDQAAAAGDRFAQVLNPITKSSFETNFQLDNLIKTMERLAGAIANTGKGAAFEDLKRDVTSLDPELQKLVNVSADLQDRLKDTPAALAEVNKLLDAAAVKGGPEDFVAAIKEAKERTDLLTGPLGFLKSLFDEETKSAREAAKALRDDYNEALLKVDRTSLSFFEAQGARFRIFKDNVAAAVEPVSRLLSSLFTNVDSGQKFFTDVRNNFFALRAAGISTGAALQQALTDSLSRSVIGTAIANVRDDVIAFGQRAITSFKELRASGVDVFNALGFAIAESFSVTKIGVKLGEIRANVISFGKNVVDGFKIMGNAIQAVSEGAIGGLADGISKVGPTIANTLGKAVGKVIQVGKDIGRGLAKGLQDESGAGNAISNLAKRIIGIFKKETEISSPSKLFFRFGKFIVQGLASGISSSISLVTSAIGALTNSFADFAKSAVTIVGVAFAGVAAKALVAGVEFNKLQQVIRGTLPVLVGSKEASDELLASINALNDSSPFARSSFLELTRVLAGFGVEAGNIPDLVDAIQQTVAATGGGEQDLLELGNAFARVQSQGRLTGDVLQSFTSRGVDAIGILAQEFNKTLPDGLKKTTTDIREMISNGLIPADVAIDKLTTGLREKFEGATEGVSKNLPGALDRINAKLRDAGAVLTKAFVNPEGGGALVEFLNSLSKAMNNIIKGVLPLLTPLLEKIAASLVKFGTFIEEIVQKATASGSALRDFVGSIGLLDDEIGPLLPILAGLLGFFPQLLSFVPVVGPLIAGLGGPFTALAAVVGVLAATNEDFRKSLQGLAETVLNVFGFLKENILGVATAFGTLLAFLPKLVAASGTVGKFGGAIASLLSKVPLLGGAFAQAGGALGVLTGPVGLIATLFVTMAIKSEAFRQALGRLFEALKPVAAFIGQVFAAAIEILDEAFKALEPAFVIIVNNTSLYLRALQPLLQILGQVVKLIKATLIPIIRQLGNVIKGVAEFFTGFVNVVIKGINFIIKAYNRLPGFLRGDKIKPLEPLVLEVKTKGVEQGSQASQKILTDSEKAIKAGADLAKSLEDNFKKAEFAANAAASKLGQSIETIRTTLQSASQTISPVFDAARAFQDSQKAVTDAQKNAAQASRAISDIEKERARALKDVISPINEVAKAERGLASVRRDLAALEREQLDVERELRDLRGEEAADDRAALDRAILRAKIALNQARQDEIDLLNEANKAEDTSVNVAGLTLDQLKSKLNNTRLSLKSQKQGVDDVNKSAKTAQQIEDEKLSAKLDVLDAEQALKDSEKARIDFERTNSEAIRANEERLVVIREDKADKLLEEQTALTEIERLRAGETTQQKIILEFDEKIKAAKDKAADAQRAVTSAINASKTAAIQLGIQEAIITGNIEEQARLEVELLRLKGQGLTLDKATNAAIESQLANIRLVMDEFRRLKGESDAAAAALKKATAQSAFSQAARAVEAFAAGSAAGAPLLPADLEKANKQLADEISKSFQELQSSGALQGPDRESSINVVSTSLNALIAAAGGAANIGGALRDVIKQILRALNLKIPGFARGFAPGDLANGGVHQGMNDGRGLVRMFEYGKEAVLPLTRAMDMQRVVNNPQVLPAILDALPRWTAPKIVTGDSSNAALANVARASRTGGGPANADVYRKKEQREFANQIGSAVKVAVKEAIAESEGLGTNDVDINVMPSANNEKVIAREVKRAVEKYLKGGF